MSYKFSSTAQDEIIKGGKYRGWKLSDVPLDYLQWSIETYRRDADKYEHEIERREMMEAANLSVAEQIVKAGYRYLAKSTHPDQGGDEEAFKDLRAAKTQLDAILTELKK